ncbi:MAG TPA: phenylalanine--tRNA ligase subunit beta [Candidatus Woesebacteria bacterium]|nr:phenylalanine--tRNA ligase subunit beta [Candidatus Woesebacteria bacterium]
MDIKITDKALRFFLDSPIKPVDLAQTISLCGPTFDRLHQLDDDYLYEIEVITNRIDTASAQGVARDSVAILKQQGIKAELKNDPYQEKIELYTHLPHTFHFDIADQEIVPRFTAISLENIEVKDSPKSTQDLLTACGERPINNIVDITNELTLLYGMPCHIFDLDKLGAQKLIIRQSRSGEKITTLDGQTNDLKEGDIVIEDGAGRLVDLCGIMGGSVAETDKHTKNILLIVPVYHPVNIRKTSLRLQKRTLASQIYEKQPDTELCLPVLTQAIKLFQERAKAHVSSSVFDSSPSIAPAKTIELDTEWANRLIGQNIPVDNYVSILKNLGFSIKNKSSQGILCTVPSWRKYDINIQEDLVEEVARVYGYSKLPSVLPQVNLAPEPKEPLLKTETDIKTFLSHRGFNEIFNHSLVSESLISKTELDKNDHLKLINALSTDLQFLRTSLVPSLLQNIKNNQGKSEEPFFIYELSNVYQKNSDKLANELSKLAIATTVDILDTKGYVELLLKNLNVTKYRYISVTDLPPYFLPEHTSVIKHQGHTLGFLGHIKPSILREIGITSNPVIVEIDTQTLSDLRSPNKIYTPISEFPELLEDMTIESTEKVGEIIAKITSVSHLVKDVQYLTSYQNKHSFRIIFSSLLNNLSQKEIAGIKEEISSLFV